MRYLGSGFARVLAWMILAIFSLGVVGSVLAGGAELENQAAERNTVDALKSCWLKLVAGMSESEACFPVRDDLRNKFIGLAESWRKDPGFRAAELEIRSIERRDKTRTDLLLFGDSGGKPIGRPITFSIEPRAGVPTIVSMNDSPSTPPIILIVSIVSTLLYSLCALALFRRMKRDPSFLLHAESRWSNRQAFLTFYPMALIPVLVLLLAVLISLARDSSFLLWIAFKSGASAGRVEGGFILTFLLLYAVAFIFYTLPYMEALRRGPKAVRDAAPGRFTRKQIAIDFTKLGLIQAFTGFVLWGVAVLLANKFGVPIILAAAISAVIGVFGGQLLFVYWVSRNTAGKLPENHAAVRAAVAAFQEANSSIVEKSISVLPKASWPAPNAFVIGLGRKRCVVAVTEPLLEHLSTDEVAAVLLHEYGHVKELHTAILALFISIIATWQLEFLLRGDAWLRGMGMSSDTSIFILRQVVLYVGLFGGLLIPFTLISRWCERRADRFAQALGRGIPLASALRKISVATETPLEWPRWAQVMSTHPSFIERIRTLRNEPRGRAPE